MNRTNQTFEVTLSRKPTTNEGQNIRRRVEYIKAIDKVEARRLVMAISQNRAFVVSSIREVRL